MNISEIKVNYQVSCINVDSNSLIVSWITESKQTSYKITIGKDTINIYESKKVDSADNILYIKDLELEPEIML